MGVSRTPSQVLCRWVRKWASWLGLHRSPRLTGGALRGSSMGTAPCVGRGSGRGLGECVGQRARRPRRKCSWGSVSSGQRARWPGAFPGATSSMCMTAGTGSPTHAVMTCVCESSERLEVVDRRPAFRLPAGTTLAAAESVSSPSASVRFFLLRYRYIRTAAAVCMSRGRDESAGSTRLPKLPPPGWQDRRGAGR